MEREILFKGYSEELKSFVYGFYQEVDVDGVAYSYIFWQGNTTPVRSDSVSQFTGMYDKNGTKIFENDKLRDNWVNDLDEIVEDYCVVVWDKENGQWAFDNSYKKDGSSYANLVKYLGQDNLEVIGNIHEN